MTSQVKKQLNPPEYQGKQPLDFGPFQAERDHFTRASSDAVMQLISEKEIPAIQQLFKDGSLTIADLTLAFLQRIERFDKDRLNSVMELNPDALDIARRLDQEVKDGKWRGALEGIPVLIKGNIGTGDQMHTTAGAAALKDVFSDRDAFLVQRLRDAGAVLLGKTNLSEWANFMTKDSANGFSVLGGQTHNPYGKYDVGGSSSGSPVALVAKLAVVAVGTETSGSVIHPAGQNSVYGLKPSIGAVSRDRIIPITSQMDTAGPMARNPTDLAILFSVMVGEDQNDAMTERAAKLAGIDYQQYLDPNRVKGRRIGLVANGKYNPRREDLAILRHAADLFKKAGAEVTEIRFRGSGVDYTDILLYGIHHDVDDFLKAIMAAGPAASMEDVVAFNQKDLKNRAPYGQNYLEESLKEKMTADEYPLIAQANREKAASAIHVALAKNHVDYLMSYSSWLSGTYAVAGFPAITLPGMFRGDSEPVGVTLVGDDLQDWDLISAACAWEQVAKPLRVEPTLNG